MCDDVSLRVSSGPEVLQGDPDSSDREETRGHRGSKARRGSGDTMLVTPFHYFSVNEMQNRGGK